MNSPQRITERLTVRSAGLGKALSCFGGDADDVLNHHCDQDVEATEIQENHGKPQQKG